jgi:hypothetical protein
MKDKSFDHHFLASLNCAWNKFAMFFACHFFIFISPPLLFLIYTRTYTQAGCQSAAPALGVAAAAAAASKDGASFFFHYFFFPPHHFFPPSAAASRTDPHPASVQGM